MDARDLFPFEHALAQSAAVGGHNKTSAAENTFGGVTDEQMRMRPREDLNSLAWLMWHIARAEDIMVNAVLMGATRSWTAVGSVVCG
jgi:DinB family protein